MNDSHTSCIPASLRFNIPLQSVGIMERFGATPLYQITDHQSAHNSQSFIDPDELSDSGDMTFSDNSSGRTMSTLQSNEVAGLSSTISPPPYRHGA